MKVRSATVRMPGEFPGLILPPLLMVVAPPVPLPESVPPELTAIALPELEPFSARVPSLMVVAPV